jgi:flagellar basal body-associated protein FliL
MTKGKKERKSKKMKKSKSRSKLLYLIVGLVVAIFIVTAGIMVLMVKEEIEKDAGPPPEKVKEPHLIVEDVFFMKSESRSNDDKVNILTTVYITNDGEAVAQNVNIIAWPIDEDKNLALDKAYAPVEIIPAQITSEIEFDIDVPPGNRHSVDLLIFERGRLILRGSGSVVIEGDYSNTPKYKTTQILGTGNDSDYDGMSDQWEIYYGLDPHDPTDADKDNDGDGMSNLGEYRSDTEPDEPAAKKVTEEDEGTLSLGSSAGTSILIVIIIIIIFVVIIIPILILTSKQEKNRNGLSNTQPFWSNQYGAPGTLQSPPLQNVPKRCPNCGGWIVNDTCTNCGGQYPVNIPGSTQITKNANNNPPGAQ